MEHNELSNHQWQYKVNILYALFNDSVGGSYHGIEWIINLEVYDAVSPSS